MNIIEQAQTQQLASFVETTTDDLFGAARQTPSPQPQPLKHRLIIAPIQYSHHCF